MAPQRERAGASPLPLQSIVAATLGAAGLTVCLLSNFATSLCGELTRNGGSETWIKVGGFLCAGAFLGATLLDSRAQRRRPGPARQPTSARRGSDG